jgi:hypothetical protein
MNFAPSTAVIRTSTVRGHSESEGLLITQRARTWPIAARPLLVYSSLSDRFASEFLSSGAGSRTSILRSTKGVGMRPSGGTLVVVLHATKAIVKSATADSRVPALRRVGFMADLGEKCQVLLRTSSNACAQLRSNSKIAERGIGRTPQCVERKRPSPSDRSLAPLCCDLGAKCHCTGE